MGKMSDNKSYRVLSILSQLQQGKTVNKERESIRYQVAERTIQRDIADIQCFLQDQASETGEIQEVIFDRKINGYRLEKKIKSEFEPKELLAVCKILLESRALVKEELFPILHKLMRCCVREEDQQQMEEFLKNEMYHYTELHHGKKLLDRLWILEQAVREHRYIEIQYKKLKDSAVVQRKVKPVGIMFSEFYFYMTAYIENTEKKKDSSCSGDTFPSPTIYRIDRLEKLSILPEHFQVPYRDRFEEGEFRKRIQFMYGGKLRTLRLKCTRQSLEAVLDRLPTAEVVKETEDGEFVVQAEVFGDGVDMWLKGQGDSVISIN